MNEINVGEFEELVLLTILILGEEAYILKIQEELLNQANRKSAMGALHVTLGRLEKKGFLTSNLGGATKERGGRRKRVYELTAAGKSAITQIHATRNSLWNKIPEFALKFSYVK
ncbi:MAG: helix-turn-helix transcriptional regulator [Bacteroidota bacterium]